MTKVEKITIPIDRETHRRVVAAAVREDRSIASFVRLAIAERLTRVEEVVGNG